MIHLIGAELSKLFHKKIVLAGLILFMLLGYMMYNGWLQKDNNIVLNEDNVYVEGEEAIALDQEIASRYEGKLTDEKVKQIVEDFELPDGFNGTDYPTGYISRNNMYGSVSAFHDEWGNYNGKTLTQVYGSEGSNMEAAYNKSWINGIYYLMYLFMLGVAYLLIVVASPAFSDEYGSGMDALILTSRYGKNRCAWAKVIAVFLFTMILNTVFLLINIVLFLVNYGLDGKNGSIQFNELGFFAGIPYEIHNAQAGIYAILLWFGATLFVVGVSLLISAYCKSSFVSLILCALFYTVPMAFNGQGQIQCMLLSLFPVQQIQLMAPFSVKPFGPVPFQLIVFCVMLAGGMFCGIFAKRGFAGHQSS